MGLYVFLSVFKSGFPLKTMHYDVETCRRLYKGD
jgi:hypothetical protein